MWQKGLRQAVLSIVPIIGVCSEVIGERNLIPSYIRVLRIRCGIISSKDVDSVSRRMPLLREGAKAESFVMEMSLKCG